MISQGNSDGNNVESAGEENNGISCYNFISLWWTSSQTPLVIICSGKDEKGTKKDGEQENKEDLEGRNHPYKNEHQALWTFIIVKGIENINKK